MTEPLKTARVPDQLEPLFREAERIVSRFFRDRVDDPTHGQIEISGERYVLVRGASLSVEFFTLVEKLYGPGRELEARSFAQNILFDLAHSIGKSDAKNFHSKMKLDDPIARLSAGPILFSHSGWAFVDILPESDPQLTADYVLVYNHPYSFESDAWQRAGTETDFPVCIMNAGYSSGWCEESFGMPLVASEVLCRARGDEACRFVMAPPEMIDRRVEQYLSTKPELAARARGYEIPDFFSRKRVEEDLKSARDELELRVAERTADLRAANERLRKEMADRQRMEEQLHKTQRLESVGRLAGGVAHDFNNLLGVIMGYSTILQRRVVAEDPIHPMLVEITEAAHMAANLTRQLLAFSRTQVVTKRRFDLHTVLTDTTRMLSRMLGDDVHLATRLVDTDLVIEADSSQIEQMLMNLAVNARDAMPDGGTLKIETAIIKRVVGSSAEAHVQLTVSDTGCGMDETTRAKAFDPFFTTKAVGEGTGLGLSTVYGIVTQSGGTITVRSEVGEGTQFEIILPLVQDKPESIPPPVPARSKRGETVLLVEDQIALRALLAQLLEEDGYQVLVAHSPADAVRIAAQYPDEIHVLLTDVVMPNMNGRVVAERVLQSWPDIKVLFMSGYAGDPDLLGGVLQGRAAFLRKPVTPEALDRGLRQVLDEL